MGSQIEFGNQRTKETRKTKELEKSDAIAGFGDRITFNFDNALNFEMCIDSLMANVTLMTGL